MASGCVCLITSFGGADEYVIDGSNAFFIDPFNEIECLEKLSRILHDTSLQKRVKIEAIKTAQNFTSVKAALSELILFREKLQIHRENFPLPKKTTLYYIPEIKKGSNSIESEDCYLRIIEPLNSKEIRDMFSIIQVDTFKLFPDNYEPESLVLVYFNEDDLNNEFLKWINEIKNLGVKFLVDFNNFFESEPYKNYYLNGKKDIIKIEEIIFVSELCFVNNESHIPMNLKQKFKEFNTPFSRQLWRIGKPKLKGKGVYEKGANDLFRIGFTGEEKDLTDLKQLEKSIVAAKSISKNNIQFEVIGTCQKTKLEFIERIGLPKNRNYDSYVNWLHKRVNWDVVLIYLPHEKITENEINKALNKYYKYTSLGLAVILSENLKNVEELKDKENVYFAANNWSSWTDCFLELHQSRQKLDGLKFDLSELPEEANSFFSLLKNFN